MESFLTIKERKEIIWEITREVIPSANLKRSGILFKIFRNSHFPTMGTKELSEKVRKEPQEFKNFCKSMVLKVNKLPEDDFNRLLKEVENLNLEQIEILLNKILFAKIDILYLIDRYKK